MMIINMKLIHNHVYSITIDEMMKMNISNWEFNRPVDTSRIVPIYDYIQQNKQVEGIIYLAQLPSNNEYICYDGIHRIHGIKRYYKETIQDNETDFEGMLGLNHDHQLFSVLVDIIPYNEYIVKERFININKSLPVPSIYTEKERQLNKIRICEYIFSYIQDKYPLFIKTTKRYNVPNINSTQFTELFTNVLTHLPEKYQIYVSEDNKSFWLEQLLSFNLFMKGLKIIHKKVNYNKKIERNNYSQLYLSYQQFKKCSSNNMFLFASSDWDKYFLHFLESDNVII